MAANFQGQGHYGHIGLMQNGTPKVHACQKWTASDRRWQKDLSTQSHGHSLQLQMWQKHTGPTLYVGQNNSIKAHSLCPVKAFGQECVIREECDTHVIVKLNDKPQMALFICG